MADDAPQPTLVSFSGRPDKPPDDHGDWWWVQADPPWSEATAEGWWQRYLRDDERLMAV